MHAANTITRQCPAKVNLALSVGPPAANGLHPLASWMVAVDFADTLTLHQAQGTASRFDITPGSNPKVAVDWPLEQDLAYRAHALLEQHLGRPLPIEAHIRKRIPAGAGLGGGSSNAAAMLVALDQLFDLGLNRDTLTRLSQRLGSDVAFMVHALRGEPSALVTGLGEQIQPLTLLEPIYLVLVFPGLVCPTGEVYAALDRLQPGTHTPPDPEPIRALAQQTPLPSTSLWNDLANPACDVRPELKMHLDQLGNALKQPVHITGSGSTLFLVTPSAPASQELAHQAAAITGLTTVATQTLTPPRQSSGGSS